MTNCGRQQEADTYLAKARDLQNKARKADQQVLPPWPACRVVFPSLQWFRLIEQAILPILHYSQHPPLLQTHSINTGKLPECVRALSAGCAVE